jgi:hypothetical protein
MIVIIDIYINSTYFNKMNNYLSPQIIEYIRDHDLYRWKFITEASVYKMFVVRNTNDVFFNDITT